MVAFEPGEDGTRVTAAHASAAHAPEGGAEPGVERRARPAGAGRGSAQAARAGWRIGRRRVVGGGHDLQVGHAGLGGKLGDALLHVRRRSDQVPELEQLQAAPVASASRLLPPR